MLYLRLRTDDKIPLITDTRENGAFKEYPIATGIVLTHGDPEHPIKTISFNMEASYRKVRYMKKDAEKHRDKKSAILNRILQYKEIRDNKQRRCRIFP